MELNEEKLERLKARIRNIWPDQYEKCEFRVGDVNDTLPHLLSSLNWRKARSVAFLDPFATQLRWNAIQAFSGTCSDVWCLFPLAGVLRMLPKRGMPSDAWAQRLDSLFGDGDWRMIYHEPEMVQMSLFGETSGEMERKEGTGALLQYVRSRYETVFPGVCEPCTLRTDKNAPLFALFSMVANGSASAIWASQRIARDLLKKL